MYTYIYTYTYTHTCNHTHTNVHVHVNVYVHICKTVYNLFGDSSKPDPASSGNQSVESQ